MKRILSLLVLAAVLGCGGSGAEKSPAAEERGSGSIRFRVSWPQNRAIPAGTKRINITVKDPEMRSPRSASIEYPQTEIVLTDVAAGEKILTAWARDASDVILASGESRMRVVANTTSAGSVELEPVPGPIDDDRYVIGGSVSIDPEDPSIVRVALNALINREDGRPVTGLNIENFKVLENEIDRPLTSVEQTNTAPSKTDIAFVIDTTGSMGGEIGGIIESVRGFASTLAASGQDVRFSGVSFGDEVREKFAFSGDVEAFRTWTSMLLATGGDDDPENPLDGIAAAVDEMEWRPDAQKVIVVVTDALIHEGDEITSRSIESVRDQVLGRYVVHTVSPSGRSPAPMSNNGSTSNGVTGLRTDRDISLLANLTGGAALMMPGNGVVDLTTLPLSEILQSGYIVRFRSNMANPPIARDIRLLIRRRGDYEADQRFEGRY